MVRIPSEYQEVEWIESDGSAYIDTGIVPSRDDVYTFRGRYRNISNGVLLGCRSSGDYKYGNQLYVNRNVDTGIKASMLVCNTADRTKAGYSKNIFFATGNNLPLEIELIDVSIYDNVDTAQWNPSFPIFLLGFNALGTNNSNIGGGRLRYFKINGRCEFLPCYRKSDNEPGMYDTVSGTFFTNAGTGEFTVGGDVSRESLSMLWLRRKVMMALASGVLLMRENFGVFPDMTPEPEPEVEE